MKIFPYRPENTNTIVRCPLPNRRCNGAVEGKSGRNGAVEGNRDRHEFLVEIGILFGNARNFKDLECTQSRWRTPEIKGIHTEKTGKAAYTVNISLVKWGGRGKAYMEPSKLVRASSTSQKE